MAYDDRDLIVRTVLGEAANQGPEGMAAVAHVILNRLKSGKYGQSVPDVLFAPKQFEPWNTRRSELMAISPNSPAYQSAASIVDRVQAGEAPDPTGGATHFANVDIVKQRGNQSGLSWIRNMYDNGSAVKIGNHTFGSPDSQPGARVSSAPPTGGQPQQSAPPMNPLLMMQNQQTQEQPQQGGLLGGLFNDPGKMAALQLLMSGLNPFSKGNEMEPFIRAAQLRQTQDYNRKIDERDYGLREKQFLLNQQNIEADNKRADEKEKRDAAAAGLTPLARDIMQETGFAPGSKEYRAEYQRRKEEEKRMSLMNEDIKGFEYAKKYEGFTGTPQEWIRSKRAGAGEYALNPTWGKDKEGKPVILQLGKGGEAIASKLPEGVEVNKGFEKIDLGTHWGIMDSVTRQMVQTLPKNIEEKAVQEAQGEARGKAVVALPAAERTSARALKMLDELEKHPGFNAAVGLIDSRLPAYSSKMADFRERVEQIDSMVFGDAVEVMRGLGALTDKEGPKITAARARLKTAKSEEDFRTALKDVREVFQDSIDSMRRKAGVSSAPIGNASAPQATGSVPPPPPGFQMVR